MVNQREQGEALEGSHRVRMIQKHLLGIGLELKVEEDTAHMKALDSDAIIHSSFGEVKSPETFNYRTHAPEENGLFCQRIFGPINDFSCACGKYKRIKHKGKICEKCGVEVTISSVRNVRSGHIALARPMLNPLFKGYLATQANMNTAEFDKIVYDSDADGGDALLEKLSTDASTKPFVLTALPVIPPTMRPLEYLGGGQWTTNDLNDLYRILIVRNNRLAALASTTMSKIIKKNEARMLQEILDQLFINEKINHYRIGEGNRVLHSITGQLDKHLKSFFTKAQDYSGTAIASYDPNLFHDTCALPVHVLYTIYEPSIIHHMKATGEIHSIRLGKKLIEQTLGGDTSRQAFVSGALQSALKERPLVVSYYGIATALYPAIHEGESFAVNSEVAQKLGLTFNGDKVNFYVPMQPEAVQDAKAMVGNYVSGEGKEIDSVFERFHKEGISGMTQRVLSGGGLPLSELDKILLR